MSDESPDFPDVLVVTMRSEPQPQNATYHLLNVLSALTTVSLVTVTLSEDSKIHGEYDVTGIASGAKAETILQTAVVFLRNQLRICAQIRAADSPVVYFFGGTAYLFPVLFAKLAGRTAVVQPRGDVPLTLQLEWSQEYPELVARLLATLVRTLEYLSLKVADRIVTYTESMAHELGLDRFEKKLYTDGTRYISVEEFEPHVPYPQRPRRVGMVGRLDIEKGTEEITGAVEMLPDDVEFLFVGDGDQREWIERRLADDIESGRVELTGQVPHEEIPQYLNELRLLVLASQPTEGLPTVIQEAFACGTPVYAPPVSGVPDVVVEGETGFLMTDRSPEHVANRIERILKREDLSEISRNCRDFAVDNYSFDAAVDRFRTFLSEL